MKTIAWRKARCSTPDGNCVELAAHGAVRDSKNPGGPRLRVDLSSLLAAVKADQLGR